MHSGKRRLLKSLTISGATITLLPKRWSSAIVTTVLTPAHAQTSQAAACTSFSEQTVDETIEINVDTNNVTGPVNAPRTGLGFSTTMTQSSGTCSNGQEQTQTVEFFGTIDTASDSISGTFNVLQFCGSEMQCEQIAQFTATKTSGALGAAEGSYQGRVVGTLRCCEDLL